MITVYVSFFGTSTNYILYEQQTRLLFAREEKHFFKI